MNPIATMRTSQRRPLGSTLALVAIAWIALIAPPCVMGLTADGPVAAAEAGADHHDCPHCPPDNAVEVVRDDCASVSAEGVTAPRADKPVEPPALATTTAPAIHGPASALRAVRASLPRPAPPPRPGPRPHLRHGQFNE